jgi:predicted MPP superfamily phosphohydrolase
MLIASLILLVLAFAAIFIWYAHYVEANNIVIQDIKVKSDRIKESLLLLQLSDLHLFKRMSPKRLSNIKNAVKKSIEKKIPDFIFLTGDYIDNNSGIEVLNEIFPLFRSNYGAYAVLGNHDYFQYNFFHIFSPLFFWVDKKPTDLQRLKESISKNKIELLINERREKNIAGIKIEILGIDALTVKENRLAGLKIAPKSDFRIVLSHYPDAIHYIKGKADILLSGHTHGGQITAFGFPVIAKSKVKKSDIKGASVYQDTVLIVSKGMGVSRYIPFRFFARPDIHIIHVEGKDYVKN